MTAAEAREVSDINLPNHKEIEWGSLLDVIKREAAFGNYSTHWSGQYALDFQERLNGLGYNTDSHNYAIGGVLLKINWEQK